MQPYSEFRPTQFDVAGLALHDQQNWMVLGISRTRDSEQLEESNFACALERLGGESETVEVHRFGHWGPGWFEIIIIDPADTERVKTAEEIESSLANYPVLDEEDVSRREYEAYLNDWEHWAPHDFANLLAKKFELSDTVEWRLWDPDVPLRELYEELGGEVWTENNTLSPMWSAVAKCDRGMLARFVWKYRRQTVKVNG